MRRKIAYPQEGYTSVLDADIKAFYDTIPHKLIMNALREKIADGWVLNSIENMLKAGVMEDGIMHETNQGTPRCTKGISLVRLLGTHETEMFQVLKKVESRQQTSPSTPIL